MTLSSIREIQNAEAQFTPDDEMEYSPTGVPGLDELLDNKARAVHGVISMRKVNRDNRVFNIIQVGKMMGIQHDTQPRFYELTQGGINVILEESVNIV